MRALLLAVTTVVLLSGCATGIDYEEPVLFSCCFLVGDSTQDVCHSSLYRLPPDERTADMVESIRRAHEVESD